MNFKLKENTLLNGDIINPEIPYAEFSEGLSESEKRRIVETLNHGHTMLMLYKQMRDNMHVKNVSLILDKMEETYTQYEYKMYESRKISRN